MGQTARVWVTGARPKTLPAAIVPVVVGTASAVAGPGSRALDGVAGGTASIIWWRAGAALLVAVALQIATNYANDYSDGIRGTDQTRAGPVRLVGQGLVEPSAVKAMALVWFVVAGLAGLVLASAAGWELLVIGGAAMAAGWFYTGGPRPYGYLGFGELSVFLFFGVVATVGSAYVQPRGWSVLALVVSLPVAAMATALLVVNNLRDIPTDRRSSKLTLAVRLGDHRTRVLFVSLFALALAGIVWASWWRPWAALAVGAIFPARAALQPVVMGATGSELIAVLEATAKTQMAMGMLLALGLWI